MNKDFMTHRKKELKTLKPFRTSPLRHAIPCGSHIKTTAAPSSGQSHLSPAHNGDEEKMSRVISFLHILYNTVMTPKTIIFSSGHEIALRYFIHNEKYIFRLISVTFD